MHIDIKVEELRNGVNKVLSVVDKKSARPILSYTLFTVKNNSLEISATDLEVSTKVKLDASSDSLGKFCVNARNLFDILKELPNTVIKLVLETDKNTLNLYCGHIHYELLIYNSDDFPQLSFGENSQLFKLDTENLINIIGKTFHAISSDETRIHLNGIFLQEVDSKLRAVATDGHRLSLLETEVDSKHIDTLINGIIIPRKGVNEIKKMAESMTESITIGLDEFFIYLNLGDRYFLSIRLIAREYPKYQAVIPTKTTYKLTSDKSLFFDAVRRIKIMSNEKSNSVKMKLKNKEVTLIANHPSLGNAEEKIEVDYEGKEMEIGFNAKYLMDTLNTLDDGEFSIELNNELSPVLIKSNNLPNYLGIIMPLKL